MISALSQGRTDVARQAHSGADDRGGQADGSRANSGVGREFGGSKHAIYAWKTKHGGMDVPQAEKLKQLRDENGRLKKLVADLSLDREALQSVVGKNGWDW